MMNKLNDVHVSYSQGKQSRRVTYVWHQHVPSCVFHQYDPHTGKTVRLDIYLLKCPKSFFDCKDEPEFEDELYEAFHGPWIGEKILF